MVRSRKILTSLQLGSHLPFWKSLPAKASYLARCLFGGLHMADAKVEMQFEAAVAFLESALKANNEKASNSACTI
jgi:hypothetical protein